MEYILIIFLIFILFDGESALIICLFGGVIIGFSNILAPEDLSRTEVIVSQNIDTNVTCVIKKQDGIETYKNCNNTVETFGDKITFVTSEPEPEKEVIKDDNLGHGW